MATLEKIRSKSVFLIVVIGVALLAFIVGDALTNSRNIFGDHTTVAKIGNVKIDYTDYQRKREELNNQLEEARKQNPAQFANFDTQLLPQMALDQLIQEAVVLGAADKAGVRSSGNLLRYYMIDNPQNKEVNDIVRQLNAMGMSVQTPAQAYEVIFNPKRNGLTDADMAPFQRAWLAAEKETQKQLGGMIYQRLLAGTVKANDLDKKALYNDYIGTTNVDLAFLPFGKLDEKEYPVSDAELKAKYDELKPLYKVDEKTKDVNFISVSIAPSTADRQAAHALALNTVKNLQDSAQLSKSIKKEGVSISRHTVRSSDVASGMLKDFLASAPADSVKLLSETLQGFTVVRMGKRTEAIDSVKISLVSAISEGVGNQVLAALNGGLSIDSISNRFSPDSVLSQPEQWIPLYTADGPTNALPEATLDSLRASAGKYIAINAGPQGMLLGKLVSQNSPVTVYEYDEATYVLGPSVKTVNDERTKLENFLAANNDAKKFAANAEKEGYNLQKFTMTQSTPAVPRMAGMNNSYYPDSRQVVRWVMIDGKEGEVSHIYESKNATSPALYAVAIVDEYDDYVPLTNPEVKNYVADEVRRDKAGDKLVEKFGKNTQSVQSAAQAMGVEVRNVPSLRFGGYSGVSDAAVAGRIAGSPADKKVVITKGDDGVYVFQVVAKNKENFPYTEQQYEQQYYQLVNPNLLQMVKGNKKFKNNIYKFEAGD